MRHFLEVDDLSSHELELVLELAEQAASPQNQPLVGKGVALVFEKASNRTRNSMERAVAQLGGHPVYIRPEEIGIDTRESAEDVVRTLGCYHEIVAARVFNHAHLERMAACEVVPVINLLSDQAHPMQALADLLTIKQIAEQPHKQAAGQGAGNGAPANLKVAYVGDANNVCRSLAIGCALLGINVAVANPPGYEPTDTDAARIQAVALASQSNFEVTNDPVAAVSGADVVYTDVWTSMGQEQERSQRLADFQSYRVDEALMAGAKSSAVFMHCLPAHREEEVSAAVIDGSQSVVWQQAENRMHAARGLLSFLTSAR